MPPPQGEVPSASEAEGVKAHSRPRLDPPPSLRRDSPLRGEQREGCDGENPIVALSRNATAMGEAAFSIPRARSGHRETPREFGLRLTLSGLSVKCFTTSVSSVPAEAVSSDHPPGTWAVPFRCGGRLRGADPPVQCPTGVGSPEPPSNPLPGGEPPIPVARRPVFRALVRPKPSEQSRRYATKGGIVNLKP